MQNFNINMNILFILLGSNMAHILHDRIHTAVAFASQWNDNANVSWFLSGGIKHPSNSGLSEAERMSDLIHQHDNMYWQYWHDTESTNTAENFVKAEEFIHNSPTKYDNAYVVTSAFHYRRAKQMCDLILTSVVPQWVLSSAECEDCDYWEQIHIQNVNADVANAMHKFAL